MASSLEVRASNIIPFSLQCLRWHFNYYAMKKPFPLIAQFYTSHLCNFRCGFCNFWRNPEKNYLLLDKYRSVIDELSSMGTCFVNFTGGEPLILPDIIERVRHTKKRIPFMHLVSNGSLLDEKMARALSSSGIDAVSISINARGSAMDKLTGVKGSFDRAVLAVKNLKKFAPNISPSINSVITPQNIPELEKVHSLSLELGVGHKFQAVSSHPEFRGQKSRAKRFDFSSADIGNVRSFLSRMSSEPNVLNSHYYLSQIPPYFEGRNASGIFAEKCITPYYFIEFWEDGSFSPCLTGTRWKRSFSIRNKTLRPVLESREYQKEQKSLESCRRCTENMQVCILEPRIFFPLPNFIKYTVLPKF